MQHCRYILLIEFQNDDALIDAVAAIEKNLPDYDYASRPLAIATGEKRAFKFVSFKGSKQVTAFPKFVKQVMTLQQKMHAVKILPGYVSMHNVVSASAHAVIGSILGEKQFQYKLQLAFSEKALTPYALTDELFKDKRSVSFLNDVWQLVRGTS